MPPGKNCLAPTDTNFGFWQESAKGFFSTGAPAENVHGKETLPLKLSKGQHNPNMRYPTNPVPSHLDDQQQQQFMDYWNRQDDRILSPYLLGYHAQEPRPHSSPALSSGLASSQHEDTLLPRNPTSFPEELKDDYLLMESLDLPPASALPRSNSAHDLGEDIDPEMLPDLETLQESFEIPPQLRVDLQASPEASQSQGDPSRNPSYSQHHHHQQQILHLCADQFEKGSSQRCFDHHSGHASGATTPSGPRSTASDESLHPGMNPTCGTLPQQVAGALLTDPAQLSPARLAHSKSVPLLDDFEGLTELQQQAADMLADDADDNLWYPMQHDEVVAHDTAAALEGLDITGAAGTSAGLPRAMSSDLECAQAQDDWPDYDVTQQKGVDTMSTADVLAELAYLNPRNKRKGKGGRQPAMDPRLDPNVDPKKAKRILANRLSAARSKMKQKSHVETLRRRIDGLSKQKSDTKASLAEAKASCDNKADANCSLKSQIRALEEHIHRQAMATIRLVDERNAMLGISAPYEPQPPTFHSDRTDVPMHAPYPNPKSNAETRARNLLPPSSRSAKNKDHQGRAPTTYSSAGKKSQESYRKGVAGVDLGQHGEHDDAMALQQSELNPPLKTWGSTGKRQPSRPRQKA